MSQSINNNNSTMQNSFPVDNKTNSKPNPTPKQNAP